MTIPPPGLRFQQPLGRQARHGFMRHGAAHAKDPRELALRRDLITDEQLAVEDETFKLRGHARNQGRLTLDGRE